jgi:hypothetical protein
MKTQREKESAVKSQFDELAKTLADGLTRRRTLQVIGGSVTGVLVFLGMPKAWGAPAKAKEKDCFKICAPFSGDLKAFNSCKKACDECEDCNGTPAVVPVGGPNRQTCFCGDGTVLNICASVDCNSGPAQDAICGPACAPHGGEFGTGCFAADASCVGALTSGLTCFGANPCRNSRGEPACC